MEDQLDKTITVVNRAKSQATAADYELAQEDYRRKLLKAEEQKRLNHSDPATIKELKALLARTDISAEDRAMLERRLKLEGRGGVKVAK